MSFQLVEQFVVRISEERHKRLTIAFYAHVRGRAVSIRNENAHKVILFSGTADILDDTDHALVSRIVARYWPPDKVDETLSGLEANRIILRMKPTKTISWDYTKSEN